MTLKWHTVLIYQSLKIINRAAGVDQAIVAEWDFSYDQGGDDEDGIQP